MRRAVEGLRLKPHRCWSTATGCRCWRCRPRPSSRATPRCRRSRPRRSWPRCTATGCAWSCTSSYPQYGFDGHKGYPHGRAPGGAARARRLRRSTGAASRRCATCSDALGGVTGAEPAAHHLARQPAAGAAAPAAPRDPAPTASSAQVWLEGDHLLRGLRWRGGARCCRRWSAESAWAQPALRALAERGAPRWWCVPDALLAELSTLESPAADRLSSCRCPAPAALRRDVPTRGARPAAGRRQRRQHPAQRRGVRLRAGAGAEGHGGAVVAEGAARRHGRALRAAAGRRAATRRRWTRCGVPLLATSSHAARALHDAPLPWPCAWVFGHEGQGVAPALLRALRADAAHPAAGRRGVAERRRCGGDLPVRIGAPARR